GAHEAVGGESARLLERADRSVGLGVAYVGGAAAVSEQTKPGQDPADLRRRGAAVSQPYGSHWCLLHRLSGTRAGPEPTRVRTGRTSCALNHRTGGPARAHHRVQSALPALGWFR